MKRHIGVSVAVAAAAVALSACSGTGTLIPEYDTPAPMPTTTTTETVTTTSTSPIPAPATSAHVATPRWMPQVSMDVDTVMRGTISDATEWWQSGVPANLGTVDAAPGDTTCAGRLGTFDGGASYCGRGVIRWNSRELHATAMDSAPDGESALWFVVLNAAHEMGHYVATFSVDPDSVSDSQWEGIGDCLAGAYLGQRFSSFVDPSTLDTAHAALMRVRPAGYAPTDAYVTGSRLKRGASQMEALKTCIRTYGR